MDINNVAGKNNLQDRIFKRVALKKNLLYYDGIRDNLGGNIDFKFFYSSSIDPLEFINIDIYRVPQAILLNENHIIAYGTISIIKEHQPKDNLTESNYGLLSIEDIEIRNIRKTKINLYISETGLREIENAIDYFESYL